MEPDKKKHFIVGAFAGVVMSIFGVWGLLVGILIIAGWEIVQLITGCGIPELADFIYGVVPFVIIWTVFYFLTRWRN